MRTQRKRPPTAARRGATGRWAGLLVGLVAVQAVGASSPGRESQPAATYRWHGEVVAHDHHSLTVRSRVVSAAGLRQVQTLAAGDPIMVTWSGFGDRANGIRFVEPVRTRGDAYRVPAELEAVDQAQSSVTFRVPIPRGRLAAARVFRPGQWLTLTSRQDATVAEAVTSVGRFGTAPASASGYRWHAEFVKLDDAGQAVVLRSRIVSRDGLAGLAGLSRGEPIVITWSGFGNRAHGIRFVDRDYTRADDRYRLPATFVAADPGTQYVTFRVEKPAGNLAATYGLAPGDWATVTSSLRVSAATAPVVGVTAFDTTRPVRLAQAAPAVTPTGTYRWNAELVALDRATQAVTVRSRLVARAGLARLATFEAGEPIVVTWSGFDRRAHGIRRVERAREAVASAGGFQLPATFEAVDAGTRYLTFTVTAAAGSLITAETLAPGDWATVTSPHETTTAAVLLVDAYDASRRARRYTWQGELVAFDPASSSVAFAAPVEDHVLRYVERFAAGDEVVLVWTPETADAVTAVRYIEHRANSVLDHGYVLPVEFATADAAGQRIVFKTKVPASMQATWAALEPGEPVAVTSLFAQRGETAAIFTE